MDNVNDLSEVLSGEPDGQAVRAASALGLDSLRRLKITDADQMGALLENYSRFYSTYPETTMPPLQFAKHLFTDRDSWFVEVSNIGVVFFTSIIPELNADISVAFWDWKFGKDRVELVRSIARTAMERFDLKRLNCVLPATNTALIDKMGKAGFVLEGRLRRGWDGNIHAVILGALPEDVCNAPEMLPSSLD